MHFYMCQYWSSLILIILILFVFRASVDFLFIQKKTQFLFTLCYRPYDFSFKAHFSYQFLLLPSVL